MTGVSSGIARNAGRACIARETALDGLDRMAAENAFECDSGYFAVTASIRSLAVGPEEAGFWPVINWPSLTV